jgi:hypothetical protein
MEKVKVNKIKVDVTLGLTAEDWSLYDLPGRDLVAQALNQGVEQKLREGNLGDLYKVLRPFAAWGAADSEGYAAIAQILRECGLDEDVYV